MRHLQKFRSSDVILPGSVMSSVCCFCLWFRYWLHLSLSIRIISVVARLSDFQTIGCGTGVVLLFIYPATWNFHRPDRSYVHPSNEPRWRPPISLWCKIRQPHRLSLLINPRVRIKGTIVIPPKERGRKRPARDFTTRLVPYTTRPLGCSSSSSPHTMPVMDPWEMLVNVAELSVSFNIHCLCIVLTLS